MAKGGGTFIATDAACGCLTAVLFAGTKYVTRRERDKCIAEWLAEGRVVRRITDAEWDAMPYPGPCAHKEPVAEVR